MRIAGFILALATLTPVFAQNQVISPGDVLVVRLVRADARLPFEDTTVITITTDGKITGLVIDGTKLPDLVVQGSSFEMASKTLLAAYEYSATLAYKKALRTGQPTLNRSQTEKFNAGFTQVVIERQTADQPLR
jgi:hypothetical protein